MKDLKKAIKLNQSKIVSNQNQAIQKFQGIAEATGIKDWKIHESIDLCHCGVNTDWWQMLKKDGTVISDVLICAECAEQIKLENERFLTTIGE